MKTWGGWGRGVQHLACLFRRHPLAVSAEKQSNLTLEGRGGGTLLFSPLKGLRQPPCRLGMSLAGD